MDDPEGANISSLGASYVQIDDMNATLAEVASPGGAVKAPPCDIASAGRIADIANCTGRLPCNEANQGQGASQSTTFLVASSAIPQTACENSRPGGRLLSYPDTAAEHRPQFVELAAAGRNDWWRYVLVFVTVIAAFIVYIVAFVLILVLEGDFGEEPGTESENGIDKILIEGIDNWGTVDTADALAAFAFVMLNFALILVVIRLAVPLIHRRPWSTLISARASFYWRGFLLSFAVTCGLLVIDLLLGLVILSDSIDVVFDAGRFFLFLPFVVVLVPIQVLTEEVLFRGYILQLVAWVTRNGALRLLVPAAPFVAMHLLNREIEQHGMWMLLIYVVLGVYMTLLAIRGNGLEYTFGFHLGINLFALTVISTTAASLPTPTIFLDRAPILPIAALELPVICALHYWIVFRLLRGRQA